MFEKIFHLKENHTDVKTEVMAGITTFMTMAYILAVNPSILSASGMDANAVLIATSLASFVGTALMALLANYPFALAPGMGLNAYFAYTVVLTMGYSWQLALMAVFVEGIIFIVLSLTNVREGHFANWVIIYSPLQMASDLIENYEGHPAFQFFRDFDADCDWSEALQGEPGEYIVVVRRADDSFFLGAGTNDEPRTLTQKLGFLKSGMTYTATIYADAPDSAENPENYRIEKRTVTSADMLEIAMTARGGQAVTFVPVNE